MFYSLLSKIRIIQFAKLHNNTTSILYEATFELIGNVNRHNCRYWSDENPHWMYEAHTQNQQKVNVWAGILNEAIIEPFFIEGNLNADNYLAMLQDEIVPAIRNIARQNFNDI
ncbi:PREDICTED: uncharacterized protein LOC108761003 [Trachymyrmex cornetzi]|uniref:uncharacterized protein LOC108761003 n=1 Tax=Trachymyrmex cornetzi TaxID=471704 RepID=UPI00084F5952|nr:PREDICTED: uncharacterized protein LOC108761003 [Trachymyrmex cornetzi]